VQRAGAACHSHRQASMRVWRCSPEGHTAICNHHAPTSANAHPFAAPLHTTQRSTASIFTPAPCLAPSRAVLTGTTAHPTTIATITTTDIQNDMTTATMTDATAAVATDMTTNTPNAMTTGTTTATHSLRAARDEIATILLPPTQTNLTIRADAHTRLHPAARGRANRPAERSKRKSPTLTRWAKPPSSLA
jgi:hypothetical protein